MERVHPARNIEAPSTTSDRIRDRRHVWEVSEVTETESLSESEFIIASPG